MRTLAIKQVVDALKESVDPEVGVNIVDLGLIYGIKIDDNNNITVEITMTTPACPIIATLLADVQLRLEKLPNVGKINLELVWEPAWSADMISEEYKRQLGV
ncbi:MAG: metal-sulfur cluster assembly factor [Candidatus Micrarchaeia archaeon]